jgi:hypothetical protein
VREEWGGDAVTRGNQRWEEIKMKRVGPAVWYPSEASGRPWVRITV